MQILRCCKVLSKSENVKLIVGFVMLVMFILLNISQFCVLLLNIILSCWSTCQQPRIHYKKFKITNFKSTSFWTLCRYLCFSSDDMFDLAWFDCRIGMIHQTWRGRQLTSRQVLSSSYLDQVEVRTGRKRGRVGPCFSGQQGLVWSTEHHRHSPLHSSPACRYYTTTRATTNISQKTSVSFM